MKKYLKRMALAALSTLLISGPASAHRIWLLPSATIFSGNDPWVTVDAAVSNDLFYFEHNALQLDNLAIAAPDGSAAAAENISKGHYRNTFDVHLTQQGTYKIATTNSGVFASFKLDGEQRRIRSSAAKIAQEIPANATDIRLSDISTRIETFVTSGKPTDAVFVLKKSGLEMLPVTHPNNLVAGERATFRLMLDGNPAPNVDVSIIPGGIRYRDKLNDTIVKTDATGAFSFTWPAPGMYWINGAVEDDKTTLKEAKRWSSYTATLEVLPQ